MSEEKDVAHCALCEDPSFIYRDCVLAAATQMRNKCVEKVKAILEERLKDLRTLVDKGEGEQGDAEYERAVLFVLGNVIDSLIAPLARINRAEARESELSNEKDASAIFELFREFHYADNPGLLRHKLEGYVATVRREERKAAWEKATNAAREMSCDRRYSSHWRNGYNQAKNAFVAALERGAEGGK